MGTYVETWKGIAFAVNRSERWCRYMARRGQDPLPVFKVGGIVRMNHLALDPGSSASGTRRAAFTRRLDAIAVFAASLPSRSSMPSLSSLLRALAVFDLLER